MTTILKVTIRSSCAPLSIEAAPVERYNTIPTFDSERNSAESATKKIPKRNKSFLCPVQAKRAEGPNAETTANGKSVVTKLNLKVFAKNARIRVGDPAANTVVLPESSGTREASRPIVANLVTRSQRAKTPAAIGPNSRNSRMGTTLK